MNDSAASDEYGPGPGQGPPFADPADRSALWVSALLRCPYCGACVLPADIKEHGDAHRRHDAEHGA